MEKEVELIRANYYDSLLSGYFECQYYHYDNYRRISKEIKQEINDNFGDIMANPKVRDKKKYVLAMKAMWIYRLNHYLKERKKERNNGK